MLNSYIAFVIMFNASDAWNEGPGHGEGWQNSYEVAREGWTAVHVWIAFENGGGFRIH